MKSESCTIHIFSANLGRWLGPQLPSEVAQAARNYLVTNDEAGRLRGVWVTVFGDDLHLHLTTYNGDFTADDTPASVALALARGAALAALEQGMALGFGSPSARLNPLQ